jgi:hypothetical protein
MPERQQRNEYPPHKYENCGPTCLVNANDPIARERCCGTCYMTHGSVSQIYPGVEVSFDATSAVASVKITRDIPPVS